MDQSSATSERDGVPNGTGGRIRAVQDWLSGRADTPLGRLALQWFRAYFAASRNSGCAVTVYSTLSVLPAALVAVALFHSSGSDTNAFAAHLISHLKLTGSTASLVQDTFGSASSNKLAATITVLVSALLWGIGIGQIYQDVYARAWGIKVGSAADQALFAIFFFVFTGAIALVVVSGGELRDTGWLVLLPVWLLGSTVFWLWVPRFLLHRTIGLRALLPGALLATVVLGGATAATPFFLPATLNANGKAFGSFGVVITTDRLGLHHDHDVAGLRGLLARLGQLAAEREATPGRRRRRRTEPPPLLSGRGGLSSSGARVGANAVAAAEADAASTGDALGCARPRAEMLVEEARRRSPALDATFETIERDSDVGGNMLAGALSYRLFVFSLPAAFFAVSGLGLLASALGIEPHLISNSVGLPGSSRTGREHGQGRLELVGRAQLVLRARLCDESPAPGHRHRSLAGLGRSAASVKVSLALARDLRRGARRAAPARGRGERRRSPDADRRHPHACRLRVRARGSSG